MILDYKLCDVPSEDPVAYACGFGHGVAGLRVRPLSPQVEVEALPPLKAYVTGYEHGRRVLLAEEEMPAWAKVIPNPIDPRFQ